MKCLLPLVLALAACSDKSIGLGQGPASDARLTADLYTWECASEATDEDPGRQWEGVFSYDLSLEYAPDALEDRGFPATGCSIATDAFPVDAGAGAVDLPDVEDPHWSNGGADGTIPHASTGYYHSAVFSNQHTCQEASDLLGDGLLLTDAGAFTGAESALPGTYNGVVVSGDLDPVTGITYGADVTVTWDAPSWSESWVQVRRENGGALVQAVTCNTTGMTDFDIDSSVWSLLSDALEVDVTNLYVAVQNVGTTTMPDGQAIETTTRAIHVAVVQN